jgi:hypothetical protein
MNAFMPTKHDANAHRKLSLNCKTKGRVTAGAYLLYIAFGPL